MSNVVNKQGIDNMESSNRIKLMGLTENGYTDGDIEYVFFPGQDQDNTQFFHRWDNLYVYDPKREYDGTSYTLLDTEHPEKCDEIAECDNELKLICQGNYEKLKDIFKEQESSNLPKHIYIGDRKTVDSSNPTLLGNSSILMIPIINNDFKTFETLINIVDFNSVRCYVGDIREDSIDMVAYLIKSDKDPRFLRTLLDQFPQIPKEFVMNSYSYYSYLDLSIQCFNFDAAEILIEQGADTSDALSHFRPNEYEEDYYNIPERLRNVANYAIKHNRPEILKNVVDLTECIVEKNKESNPNSPVNETLLNLLKIKPTVSPNQNPKKNKTSSTPLTFSGCSNSGRR